MSIRYAFPNFKQIEIEITTHCNLYCVNCDRSCRQAPSDEYMSVPQIEKFVDESIALKWQWECIKILGGEPSLHPDLFSIMRLLALYKYYNPGCRICFVTNGFGEHVHKIINELPAWVFVENTAKTNCLSCFGSYNTAPLDNPDYTDADFSTGCWITAQCGLGLTRYGYYPCGAGGSVDRVFGFNVGFKELRGVTLEALQQQLKRLCGYCGHFKETRCLSQANYEFYANNLTDQEELSRNWYDAYQRYQVKCPVLSLY